MQKSLYAIVGLGIAGCVTLMVMLDHTLEVVVRPQRSLFESELEKEFGADLAKPVSVRELDYGGRTHLHAHLVVGARWPKDAVAERAAARLWDASERGGRGVVEVVIYVDDDEGGDRLVRRVPRGPRAPSPPQPVVLPPSKPPVAPR